VESVQARWCCGGVNWNVMRFLWDRHIEHLTVMKQDTTESVYVCPSEDPVIRPSATAKATAVAISG
jgi:hypothetical protein